MTQRRVDVGSPLVFGRIQQGRLEDEAGEKLAIAISIGPGHSSQERKTTESRNPLSLAAGLQANLEESQYATSVAVYGGVIWMRWIGKLGIVDMLTVVNKL